MTPSRSVPSVVALLVMVTLAGCQGGFPWEDSTEYSIEGEVVSEAPPNTTVRDVSSPKFQREAIQAAVNRTQGDETGLYVVPRQDHEQVKRTFERFGSTTDDSQGGLEGEMYVRDGNRIIRLTFWVRELR